MHPARCTRCLLSSCLMCLWPCPTSACLSTWPVPVLPFVTGWGDNGAQHVLWRLFSLSGGKGRNCAGQECRLHGLVLVIPRRGSGLHHDARWGRRLVLLRLRSLLLPSTHRGSHGGHGDRPGSLRGSLFGDTRHLALHELFLPLLRDKQEQFSHRIAASTDRQGAERAQHCVTDVPDWPVTANCKDGSVLEHPS